MQAVQDINSQTGANLDPNQDPNDMMQNSTQILMSAMSQVPQLTEKKRTLDKHTTLLHRLLAVGSLCCLRMDTWRFSQTFTVLFVSLEAAVVPCT